MGANNQWRRRMNGMQRNRTEIVDDIYLYPIFEQTQNHISIDKNENEIENENENNKTNEYWMLPFPPLCSVTFTLWMSLFYVSLFQSHLFSILFCRAQVEALCKTLMYVKVLNEELKNEWRCVMRTKQCSRKYFNAVVFSYVIALSIQYKHRQTNTH